MTYYVTSDSFGSDLPSNWEEIAAFLNRLTDERGIAEDHSACNELWEAYWNGELKDAPTVVEKTNVINADGDEINFETAVALMDDEIREAVHNEIAPCSDQEFFTAYEKAHLEKYGEPFIVN